MQRKWKTAYLTNLDYMKWSAEDVIKSLAKLGYEGIEWTMNPHFHPDKPITQLKELIERTHEAGLGVSQIMAHEDLISKDDSKRQRIIDRIARTIQAAGECGVSGVSVVTGPAIWEPDHVRVGMDMGEEEMWGQVIDAYNVFLKTGEECGVDITTEAVYGMMVHDIYTHKWFVSQTDSPRHRVNLDPSHHVLYGIYDMKWLVHQWGDRIAHVHVKDGVGVPALNRFAFPLPGEGQVNWKDFFTALDDIGYDGWGSVEFESWPFYEQVLNCDPEAAARISLEYIDKILENLP
jgi:sugar phosphate isomerase/epimerase